MSVRACWWGLVTCVVFGLGRITTYHLIYDPLSVRRPELPGAEFEKIRPFLTRVARIRYVAETPLDEVPGVPRHNDRGDVRYAEAQYALAPTLLVRSNDAAVLTLTDFDSEDRLQQFMRRDQYLILVRVKEGAALLQLVR